MSPAPTCHLINFDWINSNEQNTLFLLISQTKAENHRSEGSIYLAKTLEQREDCWLPFFKAINEIVCSSCQVGLCVLQGAGTPQCPRQILLLTPGSG